MGGTPVKGVLEHLGALTLPSAITKYFFCSPRADFTFRCMPSSGGLYKMRYRDYIEFGIIEGRLQNIAERRGAR